MDKKIKVSVIMVTYNQEKFIDEAIRSVVLQDFPYPYELIIGDDCSTDETLIHCRKWEQKYPQIIKALKRDKNMGIQRNYIDTYNHCTGEYIAICEGDDFWCSKNKLRRQVEYMDAHSECSVCFHRVFNYYTADGSISMSNGGKQPTDTTIADLARSNYITNLSVMYRREAISGLPEWLTEIASPDYVIHMLHAASGTIHYINKPMAVYRQHSQGIWGSNIKDKQLWISLNSRKRLIEYFDGNKIVVNNLINAYTPIALSLVVHYEDIGNNHNAELVKQEILHYNSSWNDSTLQQQLIARRQELSNANNSRIFTILKKCRKAISKLLPLPRIKK